ncbi:MAG TPA: leucine-rich repeat domain-containing protein [Pyrinomonadaceae bacterium]
MDDLSLIRELEKEFGFPLNRVELENLFTEKPFPALYDWGVRNYSVDENNFVTGLAIDYCPMFFLPDNYLANFSHLQKLKIKKTLLRDYSFLKELKSLTSLDLSSNDLSDYSFLKELKSLTSLNLSSNYLSDVSFLKELKSLTSLYLSGNKLRDVSFLKELKSLTSLNLSVSYLNDYSFLKELKSLTSLYLSSNDLSDYSFLKRLKSLTSLNLSGNYLSHVSFLKELESLTSLNLSANYLSDVSFLKELKSLTSLNLSVNYLSDVSFLKELKSLTSLYLSGNKLRDVSFLKELTSLTSLNLSFNKLNDASFLKELKPLTSLNLSSNDLSDVSFLKELKSLTSLDLSFNKLSDVSFLKELKPLTSLNLSSNYLSDVSFLKELKSLTSLYLSGNKLSDVSFLKELKSLTSLNLSGNNLRDASFLKELKPLTSLNLSGNNLRDVSFLQELKALAAINLNNNPIIEPPKEVIDGGLDAIRSYYRQKSEEGVEKIYEAKMLIVGEPGAGKSTLFEKMKNPEYLPQNASKAQKNSTVGITIETLQFPFTRDNNITFKAHLWDFGGQPIQYILHQYFFTERSLYILLADDRKQLTNFPYWFEIIATLGKNCPVLVVLNEINHQSVTNFNLGEFQKEFSEKVKAIDKRDVDFSINTDGRFNLLKSEIERQLCHLEHIGQELPKTWVKVREEIELQTDPHISIDKYYEFCEKHGVKKEYRGGILQYFHDLGIALNYRNDKNLEDIVILKPNWVIDALYVVLKNTMVKNNCGRFERQFVYDLWEKEGCKRSDCKLLLALMLKGQFEVAYEVNDNFYIVPALLPFETPKYDEFASTNLVQVYFQYDFMPPGILSRLIVRLNEIIDMQNRNQIVWERGVLFKRDGSSAEVIESHHKKQLTIKVSGENFIKNKELLTVIRNEIRKIHKEWFDDRLSFQENVPCICEECRQSEPNFYTLVELEKRLQKNKTTIECRKSFEDVNVRQLLEGVYIEEKGKDKNDPKYKIAENIHIHDGSHQFGIGDKVSQKQYNVTQIAEQRINSMLEKADDAQKQTLKELENQINEVLSAYSDNLNTEQRRKAEELKDANWKGKVKFFIPFLTNLGIEIGAERDITPDEFAGGIRKALYGDEPILLNLLKDSTES